MPELLYADTTAPGGRENNQDTWGHSEVGSLQCWVVADGMGGHRGGETASKLAVETILACFKELPSLQANVLEGYLRSAHVRILEGQKTLPGMSSMRTTGVLLVSDGQQAGWAHVGDSRLYRFRPDCLPERTKDHSVPQALYEAGEIQEDDIRQHPDRNRLLRALGGEDEDLKIRVQSPVELAPWEAFLLATDGFWEYLPDTQMQVYLAKSETPQDWLNRMHQRLELMIQQECNAKNQTKATNDNYTGVAVMVGR